MNLQTETFNNVVVVHAPEELVSEQAGNISGCLTGLDRRQVVLDLDNTEAVDSRGLTALLEVQEKLREEGGDLKIAVTNGTNRKILEITRLDQQLEVFDSVIDAVKGFQE